MWKLGAVLKEWQTRVVVPLFNKGDQRLGANYGSISKSDLFQVGGGLCQGFASSPILFMVLDKILGCSRGEGFTGW